MSVYTKRVGLRNVGSYQVSGTPWVTGSTSLTAEKTWRHSFPYVTKSFTLINKGTVDLRLHFAAGQSLTFTADGAAGQQNYTSGDNVHTNYHYITVPSSNGSVTFDSKCAEIYISNPDGSTVGKYELFAELTQIPTGSMYALTGSGITEV
tara:strand:+ start:1687 stop:2136 length:450 start_codon:yes stop_codon:yes gene_type:complete